MLRFAIRCSVIALVCCSGFAFGQASAPKQQEFAPPSGKGRVVVVFSGQSGLSGYGAAAQQLADAGFSVVLVDSNDLWIKDTRQAWSLVKDVIARAQAGPGALPGKVGVVAFSLGGAPALTYAARMPDTVATVVATYPYTAFITNAPDFVGKLKVPVQVFAGTADTYKGCCLIDTARQLADSAKGASPVLLTLHEYEGAGHGFNLANASRKDQAFGQDAMERTVRILKQALPAEATR